jgi:alpha-amylase/alpha-mannosidase (GH57 family)
MKKLYVAILYHQHQPYYKDPVKNYYHFPWVRFHAIKDYYDIPAMTQKFDKLKLNINLVPSLIVQLEDYAFNNAVDKDLELTLKPVDKLTDEDKLYILEKFFRCNWDTMVYIYPRYKELLEKRGKYVTQEELLRKTKLYSNQDFLDLQVWFNLAWFDPMWRKEDEKLNELYKKQKGFTQEEKEFIIKKQREICGKILDLHKKLQEEKKIEVTTTPFYHPILPLLCDSSKAKISNPYTTLPKTIFSYPEDAKWHVEEAINCYKKHFGKNPTGLWPAEGSVSEDIIPILVDSGITWIATDEDILKNSLKTDIKNSNIDTQTVSFNDKRYLYKNYAVKHSSGKQLNIIFRDKEISDSIGFIYSKWNAKDAVKDIELKLTNIYNLVYAQQNDTTEDAIVSIILDGENCWEYYPNDGIDFLTEFYTMLTTNPIFETVLISDFLTSHKPHYVIKNLWPGSWINANYNIWIGHPEDNLAWEYLTKTRQFLINFINTHPEFDKNKLKLCWEEIYIAEGSDWYWWYGDEHYTPDNIEFDFLFRQHLKNVYIILNELPPEYLNLPIKGHLKKPEYILPTDLMSPVIDGKVTNYFEWLPAGKFAMRQFSALHQTTNFVSQLFFGFDMKNLFLRIDYNPDLATKKDLGSNLYFNIYLQRQDDNDEKNFYQIKFSFIEPVKYELVYPDKTVQELNFIAKDKIIELSIPFSLINSLPGKSLKFYLTVNKLVENNFYELERWPTHNYIELVQPDEHFAKHYWTI